MTPDLLVSHLNELEGRVLAEGYNATERDVAEARELVNQYIDYLEWLETHITVCPISDIELIVQRWYP